MGDSPDNAVVSEDEPGPAVEQLEQIQVEAVER